MNEIIEYQYCDNCKMFKPIFDFQLKDNLTNNICIECLNKKSESEKLLNEKEPENA